MRKFCYKTGFMEFRKVTAVPIGKPVASGSTNADYGRVTGTIARAQAKAQDIVRQFILPRLRNCPQVSCVDCGCADASNSMPMWTEVVRELGADRVSLILNDLRFANRERLVENQKHIHPLTSQVTLKECSYLSPLARPDSTNLAFTSFTVHWCAALVGAESPHVYPHGQGIPDASAVGFAQKAHDEMVLFFRLRYQEMSWDGFLLMINLVRSDSPTDTWNSRAFYETMQVILSEMRQRGELRSDELPQTLIYPAFFRTPDDIIGAAKTAGFRVVNPDAREIVVIPCAFYEKTAEGTKNMDEFCQQIVDYAFAWSEGSLRAALRCDEARKKVLVDLIKDRYQEYVRQSPSRFQNPVTLQYLLLRKF
jgi:hypothetical protein